ncbi:MAG: alpha/beta hydrolase-fold protein [Verrucomicrobia bacterium]|nr:alpha/beta hydrolase-fold protein [Verrucomicrobiota bacterium]
MKKSCDSLTIRVVPSLTLVLANLTLTSVVDGQLIGYGSSPVHNQGTYAQFKDVLNLQGSGNSRQAASSAPTVSPIRPPKAEYESPAIHENGRVTFAITVPEAKQVHLVGRFSSELERLPMEKDGQGVWRKTLERLEGGIYNYGFAIDGSTVIGDPLNPKVFRRAIEPTVWSFLEMPGSDGPMFYEMQDVPHGVVHRHAYQSKIASEIRTLHVYTPPGYYESSNKRFPVLYLLHGGGDKADVFLVAGRIDMILDNLIAEKKVEPMIVVMPYTNGVSPYVRRPNVVVDRTKNFGEFEDMFFAEIKPFVDSRYRISNKRENHAVAGYSVGAALSRTIGLKHLDLFAWVGSFSGGSRLSDDYEQTIPPLLRDVEKTNKLIKLHWISGPAEEKNLPEFHQGLADAGIQFVYRPDRFGHSYRTCRYILKEEFLPRLFK